MTKEVAAAMILCLLNAVNQCNSVSAPGKPVLSNCRSPEKETFSCWWEPGSDGGLPTTHRLYYQREDLEGMYECPDYFLAGRNSCFFDKSHTSIWVNYLITVEASNALGNTTSDPLEVDVMYIVQPSAPENVTVLLEEAEGNLHLLVKWEPPHETDTHSGWITLIYQLRVKRERDENWQEYMADRQTEFTIYSPHPGDLYMTQVRCNLDHSYWSEWSNTSYIQIPADNLQERPFRIMISILPAFVLFTAMSFLIMRRKSVKTFLLPPIPSPKIRGLGTQVLKSGHSEAILSALVTQSFPLMVACKEQMVEYLLVSDCDDNLPVKTQRTEKSLSAVSGVSLSSQDRTTGQSSIDSNISDSLREIGRQENVSKRNRPPPEQPLKVEPPECCPHQQQQCPCETSAGNHAKGTIHCSDCEGKPLIERTTTNVDGSIDSSYVDPQKRGEMGKQEDYNRVGGVNGDNFLFLEKSSLPHNALCDRHKDCWECTNQTLSKCHVTVAAISLGVGLLDNGYVQ